MPDPIDPLTSGLLSSAGFRHAFFTRSGGVSTGEYAALNFSTSVGDPAARVAENAERAAAWLALSGAGSLYLANQVHGADVAEISADTLPQALQSVCADALIGADSHIACGVRTADCVPLLVADPQRGRVAAIHAGWRGIAAGVVPRTIARLTQLGSRAGNLLIAIGPHIRVAAFEVSEQVADTLAEAARGRAVISRGYGARPHVDLSECIKEQLGRSGVASTNVDDVGGCTFSDAARFFSYRRQGPHSGRHLHAIVPRLGG